MAFYCSKKYYCHITPTNEAASIDQTFIGDEGGISNYGQTVSPSTTPIK